MKNRTGRYAALLTMSGVATGAVLLGPGMAMAQAAEPTVGAPPAGAAGITGIQDQWFPLSWSEWDANKKDHKKQEIVKKKEKATFEGVTWFDKKDHHKKWDDKKWDDKWGNGTQPGDDPTWNDDDPGSDVGDQAAPVAWDPDKGKWDHKKRDVVKKKQKATFERVTWFDKKDHHKKWDDKWDDKKRLGDDPTWGGDDPTWSGNDPTGSGDDQTWSGDDPTGIGNDPTGDDGDQTNLVAWDPDKGKWDHKKRDVIKKKEKATFERVTWFEKKHKKDHHKKWDGWSEQRDPGSSGPADDVDDTDDAEGVGFAG
ncbi:hypothetical protein [Frankia gtarii]|uniref:hypothetical protein n=1 Tax=Frankia gtarii TaxID=2950102 RepID=UPI0021BED952|nr:hypothetical protein [Frankia gtarii]